MVLNLLNQLVDLIDEVCKARKASSVAFFIISCSVIRLRLDKLGVGSIKVLW